MRTATHTTTEPADHATHTTPKAHPGTRSEFEAPILEVRPQTKRLRSTGRVDILRHEQPADASDFETLTLALDTRRGLILSSNYEYPGRYRPYALGFVDPPLVLEGRGREVSMRALTARGQVLLDVYEAALYAAPELSGLTRRDSCLTAHVTPSHGTTAEEERTRVPTSLSAVRAVLKHFSTDEDPRLGFYGVLGYDLVFQFDALDPRKPRPATHRDLLLYIPDTLLVSDPVRGHIHRYTYDFGYQGHSTAGVPREPVPAVFAPTPQAQVRAPAQCDHAPGQYADVVRRARAAFADGDLFEVTPSQTISQPCTVQPSRLFTTLRACNPAPYAFLANLGDDEFLVGASPEMYVRVQGRRVESCPIAGTIARGTDAESDAIQVLALLNSEKDRAELTMCTDVDRNDKARICEPGSVRLLGRRQIELYARLIHTVDHVSGELREGYDAVDALLTHMWAVTVTGAPKLDAMQFIEDCEQGPREYYGGAIGALRFDGSLDTGLILRTVHIRQGQAHIRVGATLNFDSDPEAEDRECQLKAAALLDALRSAEQAAPASLLGRHQPPTQAPRHSPLTRLDPLRVLMIDHRDSFVHTLADYFRQADCNVSTLRYGFAPIRYRELNPQLVVLSPGPGLPDDFGLRDTLQQLAALKLPVFGVCLGLQAIVEYCGGRLERLPLPVHGKTSTVLCQPVLAPRAAPATAPLDLNVQPVQSASAEYQAAPIGLFEGLPNRLSVGRYHSWIASAQHLPRELTVTARTEDGHIMALGHDQLPWYAVQFHPESILSAEGRCGLRLIQNVVAQARAASSTEPTAL